MSDEEQAGGEEDQRGQAEAAVGDDAEREVDREADRGVDGDEEAGDAEAAFDQRLRLGLAIARAPLRCSGAAPVLAQRAVLVEIQSRPAPIATKIAPSRVPTESGPPPAPRVTARMTSPRAMKTNEKARIEPW